MYIDCVDLVWWGARSQGLWTQGKNNRILSRVDWKLIGARPREHGAYRIVRKFRNDVPPCLKDELCANCVSNIPSVSGLPPITESSIPMLSSSSSSSLSSSTRNSILFKCFEKCPMFHCLYSCLFKSPIFDSKILLGHVRTDKVPVISCCNNFVVVCSEP